MRIILDLDTGIDDALALALALAHPDLELIGVTCTYGNVPVDFSVRNTLALLELLGSPDVPVYAGNEKPGFEVAEASAFIHGRSGVGEALLPPPRRRAEKEPAADFLARSVREHGSDLVIVPTGPSTTVAEAMRRDADFAPAARMVMMGGALTVPGNVSAWAEANVSQDPEATDAVLRSGADITVVGLDVTMRTRLKKQQTARWRELGTPAARAYADMADYYIGAYAVTAPYVGGCALHDPLAVAVAADPTLVETLELALHCETEGPTRGRLIGDPLRAQEPGATRVAVGVDAERFEGELCARLEEILAR